MLALRKEGRLLVLLVLAMCVTCCASGEREDDSFREGLMPVPDPTGTSIRFDPLADPIPEIPFPNDIATVVDASSPTGRRLNIRMRAPTRLEQDVRTNMNQLDGFGTFSPISVPFEAALDLRTVTAENILLLNIDPRSPRFGQRIPLDLPPYDHPDWTAFPLILEGTEHSEQHPTEPIDFGYFHFDYRWRVNNLLLEGEEEDGNCNDRLDPGEDSDFDGVLDHPNVAHAECYNPACFSGGSPNPDVCPDDHPWELNLDDQLVPHFDYETNTLILRPLVAMDQRTRYGVVLTRGLKDVDGHTIRSPFSHINHTTQTEALKPLAGILPSYGLSLSDAAFAWSFTTQTVTKGIETIRDGLRGKGALAYLADRFPPELDGIVNHGVPELGELGNTYILKPAQLQELFSIVFAAMTFSWIDLGDLFPMIQTLLDCNLKHVDYFVVGSFQTPMFLDGPDSHFDIDFDTGRARVSTESVPFWLTVPKRRGPDHPVPSWYPDPPFPVVFYGHGYSGANFEALGFSCHLARYGLATFAMDETGHGPSAELADLGNVLDEIAQDEQGNEQSLDELIAGLGPLRDLIVEFLARLVVRYDPTSEGWESLFEDCMSYANPENPKCADVGACPAKCVVLRFTETPLYQGAFLAGRAKDLTGDGVPDSGVDFWTARSFHTRDIVRQAVVDYLQALRVLQSFDGERRWAFDVNGDGETELAGDFNADGVVDVGGRCVGGGDGCDLMDPDDTDRQNYSAMGQSMGAFIVSILQAIEPSVTAIAPISGGAGLMDIGTRTSNEGVREAVYLEVLGPLLVGGAREDLCRRWTYYDVCEDEEFGDGDGWYLAFDALDGNLEKMWPITPMPALHEGDRVRVINQVNGEADQSAVVSFGFDDEGHEMLGFRLGVAADVGDLLAVTVRDGDSGKVVWSHEARSVGKGYGYKRNSPDLRRMLGLSQLILDPADPASYAPHYFWDPLPGMKPKSALINHTLGDMKVPIGTGMSLARAARILDYEHPLEVYDGLTESEMLVHEWVPEAIPRIHRFADVGKGDYFDADDLGEGLDDDCTRGTYPGGNCALHRLNEAHLPDVHEATGGSYETRHLRKTIATPGVTHRNQGQGECSGFRLPNIMVYDNALKAEDRHGIFLPAPTKPFNMDQYVINLIGRYFQTRGRELLGKHEADDATCLEDRKDRFGNPENPCEFWEGTP